MTRYARRASTFWAVHFALFIAVWTWDRAFEPTAVNFWSVLTSVFMPAVVAIALRRRLLTSRIWLALDRPRAALRDLERFSSALRRRPWLTEVFGLGLPSRFERPQDEVRALRARAHAALDGDRVGRRRPKRILKHESLRRGHIDSVPSSVPRVR